MNVAEWMELKDYIAESWDAQHLSLIAFQGLQRSEAGRTFKVESQEQMRTPKAEDRSVSALRVL